MSAASQIFQNIQALNLHCQTATVFQTLMNVTVPGPENCTSPSLCWVDGDSTITLKNISNTYNEEKCKTNIHRTYTQVTKYFKDELFHAN